MYRALPSGSVQIRSVFARANQTILTGLNKYTNYSITVSASTSRGAGNFSSPIFIVTDEDSKWQIYDIVRACPSIFGRAYSKPRNCYC